MYRRSLFILLALIISISMTPNAANGRSFSVRGLVWLDANCDGLQGAEEEPISAQSLWLLAPGADNIINTPDDQVIEYASSGASGLYAFTLGATDLDYAIRILTRARSPYHIPGPTHVGPDRTKDNDLRSDIWGTSAFRMDPTETVTGIDIGLCRTNATFLPLTTS
jgi:hypothetical protein